MDKVAVKVDLTTEIVKTLAKGRKVEFSQFKYVGSTVDIQVTVREDEDDRNIKIAGRRIPAKEIYEFGTDQSLCRALEICNHHMDRGVKI